MRVYGVLKHDGPLTLVKEQGKSIDFHCFAFEKLFLYSKEEFEKKESLYKMKGKVLLTNAGTTVEILSPKGNALSLPFFLWRLGKKKKTQTTPNQFLADTAFGSPPPPESL